MIGINTFGLAKHIQADQRKTIQRLAEIGFSLVEPLLAPLDRQGIIPKSFSAEKPCCPFWKIVQTVGSPHRQLMYLQMPPCLWKERLSIWHGCI